MDASSCCSLACNEVLSLTTVWQLGKVTQNKYGNPPARDAAPIFSLLRLNSRSAWVRGKWICCRRVFDRQRYQIDWRSWLRPKRYQQGYGYWLSTKHTITSWIWKILKWTRLLLKLPTTLSDQFRYFKIGKHQIQHLLLPVTHVESLRCSSCAFFNSFFRENEAQRSWFTGWLISDRFLIAGLRKAPIESGPRWWSDNLPALPPWISKCHKCRGMQFCPNWGDIINSVLLSPDPRSQWDLTWETILTQALLGSWIEKISFFWSIILTFS